MPMHGEHNMATPSQQQMLRSSTVPSASQYKRNPDGSYQIPGSEMVMADNDIFYMVLFDQLEYVKSRDSNGLAWDAEAWVGRDYSRLWIKTEGERLEGRSEGTIEALWSKPVAAFWDAQVGVRHDFGAGPSRQWLALAIQGVAPYWFDVEGALYLGSAGRVGARFKTDYSFRLTQTAFLTPEIEVNAYNKSDRARGIGSGLSDIQLGLRLRYELRREIAPYIGVTWGRKLGRTADFAREEGESPIERQVVAGVRIWF
ncbi:copper resistance protein B [Noviherbaspirillum sp. CPCC 100848]|uniref:Copper resistance protein B n=1 Tax=Noviherbaspirillum album TaxID=3080276 RepID=A0ABU6J3N3_9BURK|nr:copper resistance protein B [Noviherbaspirillum sp. CPCC 100848]MEC4718140.1 copper resistance protein B [Noviherbaspirillum sp. CPCC 100848]